MGYYARLTRQKSFNVWSLDKQSTGRGYGNLLVVRNKWHRQALLADAYTREQEKSPWDHRVGWKTQ